MTSWQRLAFPVDLFRNVNTGSILRAHSPAPSLLVVDEKPPRSQEVTTDTLLSKAGTPLIFLPHRSSPNLGKGDHRINGVGELLGKEQFG